MMVSQSVREQFGANAGSYVSSPAHARGASLTWLVEQVNPEPDWRLLDMATAVGHTAFAFAGRVAHVIGLDLTPQMLSLASGLASERGIANVSFAVGDVDDMPFGDETFDVVTCRIAPHHFPDVERFIGEAKRLLRRGGLLAVVDNIVPGSRLRGKKADRLRAAGAYVNAVEKLRDPSHVRCLSFEEWIDAFAAAGMQLLVQDAIDKRLTFETWAARHSEWVRTRLQVMLLRAPAAAAEFLAPQTSTGVTTFRLQEGLFLARK